MLTGVRHSTVAGVTGICWYFPGPVLWCARLTFYPAFLLHAPIRSGGGACSRLSGFMGVHSTTGSWKRPACKQRPVPLVLMNPAVWSLFGCCLVKTVPAGEVLPAEIEDEDHPEGRLAFVLLHAPDRPFYFAALDLIASGVESGGLLRLLRHRLHAGRAAVGIRVSSPRRRDLCSTSKINPGLALVALRRQAKMEGKRGPA